jgi:hypothetical protein
MTSLMAAEELLRQDALGRVQVPVERREAILAEFEKSGSSAAEFARLTGIKYQTFCHWVQKHRRKRRPGLEATDSRVKGATVQLIEALVEGDNTGGARSGRLIVELPGGSRMEVGSPVQAQMAAEVVVLIAQRSAARC